MSTEGRLRNLPAGRGSDGCAGSWRWFLKVWFQPDSVIAQGQITLGQFVAPCVSPSPHAKTFRRHTDPTNRLHRHRHCSLGGRPLDDSKQAFGRTHASAPTAGGEKQRRRLGLRARTQVASRADVLGSARAAIVAIGVRPDPGPLAIQSGALLEHGEDFRTGRSTPSLSQHGWRCVRLPRRAATTRGRARRGARPRAETVASAAPGQLSAGMVVD